MSQKTTARREATQFLQVAIAAAVEAGEYQRRRVGRRHRIEYKGAINIVTDVDKRSEAMILRRIRRAFPGHAVLAEESGVVGTKGAAVRWIIDPLDGTTNFAHGYPLWCVSIGVEREGEVVAGVVYEPNRGELFTAVRGGGAFCNGRRIQVSRAADLQKALLVTGFSYNISRTFRRDLRHFQNLLCAARAVRRDGVAAVDLAYLAAGRYDGFWETGLWPWDIAAGILLVEEAGGTLSHFDGSTLLLDSKEIVVSNGRIHRNMLKILSGGHGKRPRR